MIDKLALTLGLTNRKRSFKNSCCVETGLSDHHAIILTSLKAHFTRLKPINIQYRDYSRFNIDSFMPDLEFQFSDFTDQADVKSNYDSFVTKYTKVVNRHAPIKSKVIRGNQAPFMTKELANSIMARFKLKNRFNRTKTKENWEAFARQRNKCVKLRKTSMKDYFLKVTTGGNNIMSNKTFWKTIKPFLGSRKSPNHSFIILEENGTFHENKQEVTEILNDYFVNIVKVATVKPPPPRILMELMKFLINTKITQVLSRSNPARLNMKSLQSLLQLRTTYVTF